MVTGKKENNEWFSVSVLGRDRPGIIAGVAKALFENACNIEALTQTVIMGQFAMILIVSPLKETKADELQKALKTVGQEMNLEIHVRSLGAEERRPYEGGETEHFVITVRGEDRPGLVYAITTILAQQGINIIRLGAEVIPVGQKLEYIQIYEVDIPKHLDFGDVQEALRRRGSEIGVTVDIQHGDIFRAINQI